MRARDVMCSDVPVISRRASSLDALRMLRKNYGDASFLNAAPGLIVVNEDGTLAGILSPLSLLKALLDEAETQPAAPHDEAFFARLCQSLAGSSVEQVMDWQPITVTEDADLLEVTDLFSRHRFQRIPVVQNGAVVGLIYRSALLFALTESLLPAGRPGA